MRYQQGAAHIKSNPIYFAWGCFAVFVCALRCTARRTGSV